MTRDARAHVRAVAEALPDSLPIFDLGREPDPLPPIFAVAHLSRRFIGEQMRGGVHFGTQGWRLLLRVVGDTPNECRWALWQATQALEEQPLTVAGEATTPLLLETDDLPERDDDGRYSAAVTWTYVL